MHFVKYRIREYMGPNFDITLPSGLDCMGWRWDYLISGLSTSSFRRKSRKCARDPAFAGCGIENGESGSKNNSRD